MNTRALVIFIVLAAVAAHAEIPDAPRPAQNQDALLRAVGMKPIVKSSPQDRAINGALWSGVAITRFLDWTSTEQCLRRPYAQCHEALLPGALVRSKTGFAFFEVGMTAASIEGQRLLEQHHHARFARIAQMVDVASMSYTVIRNYQRCGSTPKSGAQTQSQTLSPPLHITFGGGK